MLVPNCVPHTEVHISTTEPGLEKYEKPLKQSLNVTHWYEYSRICWGFIRESNTFLYLFELKIYPKKDSTHSVHVRIPKVQSTVHQTLIDLCLKYCTYSIPVVYFIPFGILDTTYVMF